MKNYKNIMLLLLLATVCVAAKAVDTREQMKDSVARLMIQQADQKTRAGDYRSASALFTRLAAYNDSTQDLLSHHKIKVLKDSQQIQELRNENAMLQSHLMTHVLLGASAVVVLLLVLYFVVLRHVRTLLGRKKRLAVQIVELERTTANKSLLVSNMSHEIRTPLNALTGFSEILCSTDLDAESIKQFADIIQLNSNLLVKLIDDVVDLSTLDLNNMKYKLEVKDAVALCRGVIESIQQIKQTEAEISFQTDLQALSLYTDSQRLQQVLINLIVNATKFCKQGSITLRLQQKERVAYFTVTDTGCGIPLEQQSQVFGRFEKLNEHADGTGLGLSICEVIIKSFGGKIGIDPIYTSGTRFYFTHPLPNAK